MKISKSIRAIGSLILIAVTALSLFGCSTAPSGGEASPTASASASSAASPSASVAPSTITYPDTITVVWYPNESASDYDGARTHFEELVAQATGKKVIDKVTTDYNIAIEALASGQAQICFMGAQGYVQAQASSADVKPLVVNTGASGTLADAIYFSWINVNKGEEQNYMKDGKYSIENIQGKKMSVVSNSSTSGFKIPTTNIINYFKTMDQWKDINTDALVEGDDDMFFSEVLFGGSHQGSAVNLLTEKADVAAFCDTELVMYANPVSGDNMTAGSIWEIKSDATAPFDTLVGKQFVILSSTPVINGPFAYNSSTISPEDVTAIQDLLTSDTVAGDTMIFVPKDSTNKSFFKKSGDERFVVPEDSFYDPIRALQNQ